jgi:4,5-DOPA dioxygenase extradiol
MGETIMSRESDKIPSLGLYLSHGGGPSPLLEDKGHQNLINFIREITVQNKHPLCQI